MFMQSRARMQMVDPGRHAKDSWRCSGCGLPVGVAISPLCAFCSEHEAVLKAGGNVPIPNYDLR